MQIVDQSALPSGAATVARSPMAIIVALIAAQFVAADGITGIYAMLPTIYREFPGQASMIGWIVTTYFLVAAMVGAVGGRLADLIGRRTVAIAVLGVASIGSLLGASAESPAMLVVASLLLGTTATLTPILIGLAREHLRADRVGLGVGAITAAGSAGAGLIFLIAGMMVDHFGRPGGYLLTATLAILAATLLLVTVPRPPRSGFRMRDVDFARGILFGPAVAGMILAVETGATRGVADGVAIGLFAASLLLAFYWARNQLTRSRPLIDLRILSHGQVPRTMFVMLIFGIAGIQQGQIFSLLLQQSPASGAGFGFSATIAGLLMVPINGTAAIVSPLAGVLCKRAGPWPVALAGAAIIVLAWLICAFTFGSLVPLILSAILSLVGLSLLMPANYMLIVEATPPDLTSGAAGLGGTLFNLGFAVGSQILLGILMGHASGAGGQPGVADFQFAFLWLASGSSIMVMALLMGRGRSRAVMT